mgnify:CR=1 FL=1
MSESDLKTFLTGCAVCAVIGGLLIVGLFWFVPYWYMPFAPQP